LQSDNFTGTEFSVFKYYYKNNLR